MSTFLLVIGVLLLPLVSFAANEHHPNQQADKLVMWDVKIGDEDRRNGLEGEMYCYPMEACSISPTGDFIQMKTGYPGNEQLPMWFITLLQNISASDYEFLSIIYQASDSYITVGINAKDDSLEIQDDNEYSTQDDNEDSIFNFVGIPNPDATKKQHIDIPLAQFDLGSKILNSVMITGNHASCYINIYEISLGSTCNKIHSSESCKPPGPAISSSMSKGISHRDWPESCKPPGPAISSSRMSKDISHMDWTDSCKPPGPAISSSPMSKDISHMDWTDSCKPPVPAISSSPMSKDISHIDWTDSCKPPGPAISSSPMSKDIEDRQLKNGVNAPASRKTKERRKPIDAHMERNLTKQRESDVGKKDGPSIPDYDISNGEGLAKTSIGVSKFENWRADIKPTSFKKEEHVPEKKPIGRKKEPTGASVKGDPRELLPWRRIRGDTGYSKAISLSDDDDSEGSAYTSAEVSECETWGVDLNRISSEKEEKVPMKKPIGPKKERTGGSVEADHRQVVAKKTPIVAKKTPIVAKKTPIVAKKTPIVAKKTPVVAKKTPIVFKTGDRKAISLTDDDDDDILTSSAVRTASCFGAIVMVAIGTFVLL